MRQFDVFDNPAERAREFAPYLVLLSSHLLLDLEEVVVCPWVSDRRRPSSKLEPQVAVLGQALVLSLTDLFSVRSQELRAPVASLAHAEDAIRRALERLFSGF